MLVKRGYIMHPGVEQAALRMCRRASYSQVALIFSSTNFLHSSAPKEDEMLGSTRPLRTQVGVTWMPFCLLTARR